MTYISVSRCFFIDTSGFNNVNMTSSIQNVSKLQTDVSMLFAITT